MFRLESLFTPPHWPNGMVSASRAADLGSILAFMEDLSRSSHTSDLKIGTPEITLVLEVSAGTDWPSISIL